MASAERDIRRLHCRRDQPLRLAWPFRIGYPCGPRLEPNARLSSSKTLTTAYLFQIIACTDTLQFAFGTQSTAPAKTNQNRISVGITATRHGADRKFGLSACLFPTTFPSNNISFGG